MDALLLSPCLVPKAPEIAVVTVVVVDVAESAINLLVALYLSM